MIVEFPKPDAELAAIGRRLRDLRTARGVALDGMAANVGISPSQMSSAERGYLRLTSAQLYAVTLHLHIPMRLLFEDSAPPPRLRH
jgi:transcriptional regulator with XRE-family HTH domain